MHLHVVHLQHVEKQDRSRVALIEANSSDDARDRAEAYAEENLPGYTVTGVQIVDQELLGAGELVFVHGAESGSTSW